MNAADGHPAAAGRQSAAGDWHIADAKDSAARDEHPVVTAGRLVLRAFAPSDTAEVRRLAGDEAIASTMMSVPHPMDDRVAADWIARHAGMWRQAKGVSFAVTLRSSGRLVGGVWILLRDKDNSGKLSYWIGKEFWSRGYCTAAAGAAVRFAFSAFDIDSIFALYFTRNRASGRVMQKIGMARAEHMPARAEYRGRREDLDRYVINRSDQPGD